MNDEREKSLPKWAQQMIAELRQRINSNEEPLLKELVRLRPKVELLQASNEALHELLRCAAKGGHVSAADIESVLSGYDLQLVKSDD